MTPERAFRRLRRAVGARILDEACSHEHAASGGHLVGDVAKLSLAMVVVHVFVDIPAHEIGHWLAGLLLGVHWDAARGAFVSTIGGTDLTGAVAIVYLAGGVVSGAVLSVMAILAPPPWRNGILPLAAAEFAYAPLDTSHLGDAAGLVALLAVSTWILSVYVRNYLTATDEPTVPGDPVAEEARRTRFLECIAAVRLDVDGVGCSTGSVRDRRTGAARRAGLTRPRQLRRLA